MTKPNKQRAGLQKKVSSVFKGVSIPGGKHTGEPFHMYAPERKAVSQNTMPDDSRPLSGPEAEKVPQPEVSPNQTNRQEAAAPEPSLSTGVKICQSPDVETPELSEESQSMAAPEPTVHYAPEISTKPKTVQTPVVNKPDPLENPADCTIPERVSDSAPPVSTDRQTVQSSLMKKLAQAEEPEAAAGCSPSIPAKPGIVQSPATKPPDPAEEPVDQAITKKATAPAPPVATNRPTSQSSLMKKLAEPEESADEAITKRVAGTQGPVSTNRQTQLTNPREPESPADPYAQSNHPLADSFEDITDDIGFLQQIKDKLFSSSEDGRSAKDKVMVMLVPILAIVMIFTFRQVLHKSPGKARGAEKKDKKVVAAANSGDEIVWNLPDPLPAITRDPLILPEQNDTANSDQDAAVDPGRDTTTGQTQAGMLQVRDIVYSEDRASALIGNQIVLAGSTINGVTIVKIERDSVEFERNGETWVQKLHN